MRADEHVELSIRVEREPHDALGEVHVGDIASDADRLAATVADPLDDAVDAAGVDARAAFDVAAGIGDDELCALRSEGGAQA